MNMRNWLYLLGLTMILSCKTNDKPCLAMSQVWGVTMEGYDPTTYNNLLQQYDSFDVRFSTGENVTIIPNFSNGNFFLQTQNKLNPIIYFRVKPSTNIDTINIYGRLTNWSDGSCSGNIYSVDSLLYNGNSLYSYYAFYYNQ